MAFVQRAQNPVGGIESGNRVGDRRPDDARAGGIQQQAKKSARGLRDRVEGGTIAIRPGRAEARDRTIDQARIDLAQTLDADVQTFADAGPEILDEDVGVGDEAVELRQI